MADWIEWAGGDCPVADDTIVETKYCRGDVEHGVAGRYRWGWIFDGQGGDIVAYRVINTPRAKFDAMSPEQEALAIDISIQIANGARPDAVQILEWAEALYVAEVGRPRDGVA